MSDIVVAGHEKIVLAVNRLNFKPVVSQVIASRKLIENRDIGDFVGTPLEDQVRARPNTTKAVIFFCNFKEPPFRKRVGYPFVRATYNIPDLKRSAIDWLTIKNACGGTEGYTWGRFLATANLSNGRQMAIYGGSEESAEQRLKALAELSTAKILTLSISEQKKEGLRATDKKLYKATTRVYPAYFSIINSEKIIVESNRELSGINATLRGDFIRKKTQKIPLWVAREPSNAKAIIAEALRVRGVDTNQE